MEIHKPKPFHGWREFLKEYGIIVLGVLTALAAEQVVESWRHHEQVEHGEAALKQNYAGVLRWNAELELTTACVSARAREIRAILDDAAARRRLPRVGPVPAPGPRPWEVSSWDAMVASQAAAHVPPDQGVRYASIAHSARNVQVLNYEEAASWSVLSSLSGPPRPFSEAEEASLRATLARAQQQSAMLRLMAASIEDRILKTGLIDSRTLAVSRDKALHPPSPYDMCTPIEVGST